MLTVCELEAQLTYQFDVCFLCFPALALRPSVCFYIWCDGLKNSRLSDLLTSPHEPPAFVLCLQFIFWPLCLSVRPSCYLLLSNNMGQHQVVNSDSSACRELGEGPGVSYPGLSGGLSHSRCHSSHRQVVTGLTSVSVWTVNLSHYFF